MSWCRTEKNHRWDDRIPRGSSLALVLVAAALGQSPVHAETIVGPPSDVQQILGLQFASGGQNYDVNVTFVSETPNSTAPYSTAFASGPSLFQGSEQGANDAVNAIDSALISDNATHVGSSSFGFMVPFEVPDATSVAVIYGGNVGLTGQDWTNFGTGSGNAALGGVNGQAWAVVNPVNPVPLPAAGWLLLSGLGSLGMFTRRRCTTRLQNQATT